MPSPAECADPLPAPAGCSCDQSNVLTVSHAIITLDQIGVGIRLLIEQHTVPFIPHVGMSNNIFRGFSCQGIGNTTV